MNAPRVVPQIRGPLGSFQMIDPDRAVFIVVVLGVLAGVVWG